MIYSKAKTNIKTGDALFFSGGSWKSWYGIQIMMVRMFKPSKWSHVGMAWVANGRIFIMEAVGSGIRLYPLSMEIPFGWVSKEKELSQNALEWAFQRIGVKYPPKWKMVLSKGLGLKINLRGSMDCSDYFLNILRQDGIFLECDVDPTSICDRVMEDWGSLTLVTKDPNDQNATNKTNTP